MPCIIRPNVSAHSEHYFSANRSDYTRGPQWFDTGIADITLKLEQVTDQVSLSVELNRDMKYTLVISDASIAQNIYHGTSLGI